MTGKWASGLSFCASANVCLFSRIIRTVPQFLTSRIPIHFRVLTLKALCEIRMDRDDLRGVAADAAALPPSLAEAPPMKPPKAPPPPPPPRPPPSRTTRVTFTTALAASAAAATATAPVVKPRKKAKGSGPDGSVLEQHEVRKEPLGVDASGVTYWLLDCWDTSQEDAINYGVSLYRELPSTTSKWVRILWHAFLYSWVGGSLGGSCEAVLLSSLEIDHGSMSPSTLTRREASAGQGASSSAPEPAGKGSKKARIDWKRLKAYRVPPPEEAGRWERVACTEQEMEEVGGRLKRSLKRPDSTLGTKVSVVKAHR